MLYGLGRGLQLHHASCAAAALPCANFCVPESKPACHVLQSIEAELEELKAQSKAIRVLVHTQIKKVSNWGQKKAHMLEVQVSRPCLLCICPCESYVRPSSVASHLPGGPAFTP